jgi:hypothetical protein
MISNNEIAILTKLNELAERYGLKPSDFNATVRSDPEGPDTILRFEADAHGNALREERYGKMIAALGVDADGYLRGSDEHIIDALDTALQNAPRRRL